MEGYIICGYAMYRQLMEGPAVYVYEQLICGRKQTLCTDKLLMDKLCQDKIRYGKLCYMASCDTTACYIKSFGNAINGQAVVWA